MINRIFHNFLFFSFVSVFNFKKMFCFVVVLVLYSRQIYIVANRPAIFSGCCCRIESTKKPTTQIKQKKGKNPILVTWRTSLIHIAHRKRNTHRNLWFCFRNNSILFRYFLFLTRCSFHSFCVWPIRSLFLSRAHNFLVFSLSTTEYLFHCIPLCVLCPGVWPLWVICFESIGDNKKIFHITNRGRIKSAVRILYYDNDGGRGSFHLSKQKIKFYITHSLALRALIHTHTRHRGREKEWKTQREWEYEGWLCISRIHVRNNKMNELNLVFYIYVNVKTK